MFQIYLPIAEMSVNWLIVLTMGAGVGVLSGMFGVGGGFLMTPLLIFYGIPPSVAVATQANQIVASSISGVMAHWRRKTVDFQMGTVLLAGGIAGSFIGVGIFQVLRALGQVDLLISLSYVVFLGTIGSLMMIEGLRTIRARKKGNPAIGRGTRRHGWIHGLPFKMRFKRSRLYISAILPFAIGAVVGILAAIMGVGGGFIMLPAMIYILHMPTNVVIGTSLFQILFVTALVTILHAVSNQSVDLVLAVLLIVGGVIGVQVGVQIAQRLRGEQLRALLGAIVLAVCIKLGLDLVLTPANLFSLSVGGGH